MASVRQIATQAGVSIATVSRVINNSPKVSESARARVLEVINQKQYKPKTGKLSATNVAYVFTDAITLGSPYDAGVLAGMSSGLEYNELDLLVLNGKSCRQGGETFQDVFRRKGVCGVIVRTTSASVGLCRAILQSGLPAVVIGDEIEGYESLCLDVDSRSASRDAVEHLIELGHQKIAFCTNIVEDKDHSDRYGGYLDALEQADIDYNSKLHFRVPASRQGGEQLARRLAAMVEPPTALFVADPATCLGLITETRKLGISVPGQLSIAGFDDAETRLLTSPTLTAVCQDAQQLGNQAMRKLVGLMPDDGGVTENEDGPLMAWFEVNESTGSVPSD
ncbi:MAG: LacI family DNA-binding transcriptional regulator [Phycisphaeraceae bacterium]